MSVRNRSAPEETYLGNGKFIEQPNLRGPFQLGVRPYSCPTYFQDLSNDDVGILDETFENGDKFVSVLLQKRRFDLDRCILIDEREYQQDIESSYICEKNKRRTENSRNENVPGLVNESASSFVLFLRRIFKSFGSDLTSHGNASRTALRSLPLAKREALLKSFKVTRMRSLCDPAK